MHVHHLLNANCIKELVWDLKWVCMEYFKTVLCVINSSRQEIKPIISYYAFPKAT